MDKAGVVKKLAEKLNLDEAHSEAFVKAFSEVLAEYFKNGEKVVLADFGSFYIREDKTIQFNPSVRLRDLVG
ncbi:MAG TPA: HU family DNA-binding protein [Candidatus Saccharimonadales bacterium]|nr:HU family DNA-binding protein [Candidatus Saccharimonadales bacterium]